MNPVMVEGLTVRYGRRVAVNNVSLAVSEGAVYALLGRNGAGKSSLVRCLVGEQKPAAGRGSLLGRDVWKERASILAEVGVVPEEPDMPPAMTPRQIARFCARLYPRWDGAGVEARLQRFGVPRDVAFGRLSLRDYYPQLTQAERDEREQFVVEACYHMRDRFNQWELWERLGFPAEECSQAVMESDQMKQFRTRLFTRIVPTVKDIGLWGPIVQKGYSDMGVMDFAKVDAAAMLDNDNKVAEEFDARARLRDSAVAAAAE